MPAGYSSEAKTARSTPWTRLRDVCGGTSGHLPPSRRRSPSAITARPLSLAIPMEMFMPSNRRMALYFGKYTPIRTPHYRLSASRERAFIRSHLFGRRRPRHRQRHGLREHRRDQCNGRKCPARVSLLNNESAIPTQLPRSIDGSYI